MADMFHPKTGLHYRHAFPKGPVWYEIKRCYEKYAEHNHHVSVLLINQFQKLKPNWLSRSGRLFMIFWNRVPIDILKARNYYAICRYCEIVARDSAIPKQHKSIFDSFVKNSHLYDGIFLHTKFGVELLKKTFQFKNVFYTPIGYNPAIMGQPDFNTKKDYDIVYYGSALPNDKRKLMLPCLREHLGNYFTNISGTFELARKGKLDRSKAIIHIPHADNCSFATMRLWHAIATSACMLIEPMDTFPAIPNEHYIQIPRMSVGNIKHVCNFIIDKLKNTNLLDIARKAHNDLSCYTIHRCMEDFVVPASMEIIKNPPGAK